MSIRIRRGIARTCIALSTGMLIATAVLAGGHGARVYSFGAVSILSSLLYLRLTRGRS